MTLSQIQQLVCASALGVIITARLLSRFLWTVADLTEGQVNEQNLFLHMKSFAIQSLPHLSDVFVFHGYCVPLWCATTPSELAANAVEAPEGGRPEEEREVGGCCGGSGCLCPVCRLRYLRRPRLYRTLGSAPPLVLIVWVRPVHQSELDSKRDSIHIGACNRQDVLALQFGDQVFQIVELLQFVRRNVVPHQ